MSPVLTEYFIPEYFNDITVDKVYIDGPCGSKTIDKVYIAGPCGSKTIDKVYIDGPCGSKTLAGVLLALFKTVSYVTHFYK